MIILLLIIAFAYLLLEGAIPIPANSCLTCLGLILMIGFVLCIPIILSILDFLSRILG